MADNTAEAAAPTEVVGERQATAAARGGRPLVTVKAVNSAIRTRSDDDSGLELGKTVYCWVFDRGTPTTSRKA